MDGSQPDIRTKVDDSRGLLKKIQLIIPGFRGYRKLEDLRAADELLRKQLSTALQVGETRLQNLRSWLVSRNNFTDLTVVASSISRLQQLDGEILHSEQGYSGISPAIRIGDQQLNALYQYDLNFLEAASTISSLADFTEIMANYSRDTMSSKLSQLNDAVLRTKLAWEQRINAIEGIGLNKGGN